mmetsp:Transcript_18048/g.50141  ORF Transcript_18048/g.50141 Transcript_18048/m.50141 type:complete len:299 (+) Transcript_18048:1274-2170(+)
MHSQGIRKGIPLSGHAGLFVETSSLVGPHDVGLFVLAAARNDKEIFDQWHRIQEGCRTASEEIQGNDALRRPGVEGNVALQKDSRTADTLGVHSVAVIGKQCQSAIVHHGNHRRGEPGLRIEKGSIQAINVHQQVLTRREMLFLVLLVIGIAILVDGELSVHRIGDVVCGRSVGGFVVFVFVVVVDSVFRGLQPLRRGQCREARVKVLCGVDRVGDDLPGMRLRCRKQAAVLPHGTALGRETGMVENSNVLIIRNEVKPRDATHRERNGTAHDQARGQKIDRDGGSDDTFLFGFSHDD